MWSATSRRTHDGQVLGTHQRTNPQRAIQDSHWLVGDHRQAGTLAVGQRADLVALDRDFDILGPEGLRDAAVSAVMVDGKWAVAP
ncbi:amidohydrolase family protein [Allosaccharopolyspora coralli]|uniref:Amidohydrolase family protein n=1 Tax=Allosaccharopolyspora coralli TaxID=2665642 RepID=A0A5Q3QAH4_9PSEU|nr:amidohydrolase family protein [Allosaccharopolyspora coralli]QGK70194.1 amidohydrolase family protein [Allosaccharopolyspora coralli]